MKKNINIVIELNWFEKFYDETFKKSREKEHCVNGESWKYHYTFGRLDYISLSNRNQSRNFVNNKGYEVTHHITETIYLNSKGYSFPPFSLEKKSWCLYIDPKKKGTSTYMFSNYSIGEQIGYFIDTFGNKIRKQYVSNYDNDGNKHGLFQKWNLEGELYEDGEYSHNKPIGNIISRCPKCKRITKEEYYDKFGKPIREHIEYNCYNCDNNRIIKLKRIFHNGYKHYEQIVYFDHNESEFCNEEENYIVHQVGSQFLIEDNICNFKIYYKNINGRIKEQGKLKIENMKEVDDFKYILDCYKSTNPQIHNELLYGENKFFSKEGLLVEIVEWEKGHIVKKINYLEEKTTIYDH